MEYSGLRYSEVREKTNRVREKILGSAVRSARREKWVMLALASLELVTSVYGVGTDGPCFSYFSFSNLKFVE